MKIRLLGEVSANDDGGALVDVGPAKCRTVLAALALSPGSAVPVSRLVEMVWGERPPRTADKTLQSYVTRLRKVLGPDSIARIGAAYRLDLDAEVVDVVRFQRLLTTGDVEAALAEWTGTPLAGLDGHGLTATVDSLVEKWLGALELDLARRVDTDPSAVIGALTELTADHPFREGLWALLMTALYQVGRQADALAAYRRARRHLVEELGVEPGLRLRELESSILGQDQQLRVDRSTRGPTVGVPTGTVTFGFCDVDGATGAGSADGPGTAEALADHDELVRATTERHGGYVFAIGGDSFGVAFHRATDAVAWADELHAAMRREPRLHDAGIRVRVGLHTGETHERAKGYFGPAVVVTARLAAAAHGGQTLVSGVTAALLAAGDHGDLDLRDLGTFRLDGVVAEQRIMQLGDGEHPPLRTAEGRRGNLPRRVGRLIGREEDLDVVADALDGSPVVTLVGPGGIGKTRLAVAAASRAEADFVGGAWLVELAAIAASDDVPRSIAEALGVKEGSGQTPTDAVVAMLQSRRALLILDNCEHIVDGVARLTRAVVENCPNVRVLATSREGLGLGNGHEQLVVVGPLEPAGSGVELFNDRAAGHSRTYDPDASRTEVQEICRRLDGVPLAIELAAARVRTITPGELLERLDDRLRLLAGGRRTSIERHRTMRATIEWSYDLLTPSEQLLFQRMSIFAGSFDLTAAETVVADADLDAGHVDDLLGSLIDRSMLVVESGPFGHRFRLLETMRQFAAEHLSASGQTDLLAARHARWCYEQVSRVAELLAGRAEAEGAARLDELWLNLRAAVDWACAIRDRQLARDLVEPIATEIYVRSRGEIGDWAERILEITPPDDEETTLFGLIWAARSYMRHLDREGYEELVGRYGEPDHPMLRYARAFVESNYKEMAEAAPAAMVELRRQGKDFVADLFEVAAHATALLLTGRLQEHEELLVPRLDHLRSHGPPTCLNWALTQLAMSASLQGRHHDAWLLFDEASRVLVTDGTYSMTNPFDARAALRRGDRVGAVRILLAYIVEILVNDNLYLTSLACVEFANLMTATGNLADAARILEHLRVVGALDHRLPWAYLAADAIHAISARSEPTPPDPPPVDDREALTYMRDTLRDLD